jgi:ParB/RepB/Spo0J family partition protein
MNAPTDFRLQDVALSAITLSGTNPRTQFDNDAMIELTESVRQHGILQALLLRPGADGESFELIAGERRYRAAVAAGLSTVPAQIRNLTDAEAIELQIVENLQRKDVTAIEEAVGYERLMNLTGATANEIAAMVHKSRSYVYETLQLLNLLPAAREAMLDGRLPRSHAGLLIRLSSAAHQEAALERILTGPAYAPGLMSYREAKSCIAQGFVRYLNNSPIRIEHSYGDLVSCQACPKRSGNNEELMEAYPHTKMVCADPACYDVKVDREFQARRDALIASGAVVFTVEKMPKEYDFFELSQFAALGHRSISAALGTKSQIETAVWLQPNCAEQRIIKRSYAEQLLNKKGLSLAHIKEKANSRDKLSQKEQIALWEKHGVAKNEAYKAARERVIAVIPEHMNEHLFRIAIAALQCCDGEFLDRPGQYNMRCADRLAGLEQMDSVQLATELVRASVGYSDKDVLYSWNWQEGHDALEFFCRELNIPIALNEPGTEPHAKTDNQGDDDDA